MSGLIIRGEQDMIFKLSAAAQELNMHRYTTAVVNSYIFICISYILETYKAVFYTLRMKP